MIIYYTQTFSCFKKSLNYISRNLIQSAIETIFIYNKILFRFKKVIASYIPIKRLI